MYPKKIKISSGLSLNAVQTDKFKTETLSVSLVTPIDQKLSPMSLLVLSLIKRGCEKFPSQGEINLRLDELYATSISVRSNRMGDYNVLGFTAEMLCGMYTDGKTDILGGTLDVLTQLLFHPLTDQNGHFLSAYMESEKKNQCDMIEAQINNPRAYASRRCREIMFEGETYGIGLLGTVEQISAMTAEELMRCYQSLISDFHYEFFYIGPRSMDEVAEKIAQFFLPQIKQKSYAKIMPPTARSLVSEVRRVTEDMPLAQGKLVLGFRTGINLFSTDFYAMLVANEIYGWSPVSKLFMNVRERLGLCYYCSSTFDIYSGAVFVSCGISPCNKEKAEKEILCQLDKMVNGEIEEGELIAAKHSLCNTYRSLGDSPALLESYYFCRNAFGVACSVEECMQNIEAVKMEDVIAAAAKISLDTVYFLNGNGEEGENAND